MGFLKDSLVEVDPFDRRGGDHGAHQQSATGGWVGQVRIGSKQTLLHAAMVPDARVVRGWQVAIEAGRAGQRRHAGQSQSREGRRSSRRGTYRSPGSGSLTAWGSQNGTCSAEPYGNNRVVCGRPGIESRRCCFRHRGLTFVLTVLGFPGGTVIESQRRSGADLFIVDNSVEGYAAGQGRSSGGQGVMTFHSSNGGDHAAYL